MLRWDGPITGQSAGQIGFYDLSTSLKGQKCTITHFNQAGYNITHFQYVIISMQSKRTFDRSQFLSESMSHTRINHVYIYQEILFK